MRPMLRSLSVGVVCLISLVGLLFGPAVFAGTNETKVILGTATKGGGFQLFGQALAEVINSTGGGLKVEARATKGSTENLALLEAGKIDIGLVEGNAAREALDGIDRPRAKLKVLAVMYPNPGMFVVRADSTYRTIDDLRGKPIAFGTRASGLRILANDVLDGLELNPEKDFKQVILDKAADGPRRVLNREVEALWGAGIGWPGFVQVANGPAGARFIAPSAAQIKQILERHPHLKPMSVPADTYKGQEQRIESVGLWSLVLVRPGMDNDAVYQLARAMHRGEGELARRLKQGRYTTAKNSAAQIPWQQMHPGAARYLLEAGVLKIDN